jgi:hypothetical protein
MSEEKKTEKVAPVAENKMEVDEEVCFWGLGENKC